MIALAAPDLFAPAGGASLARFLDEHLPPRPAPLTSAEAVERMLAGCACGNPAVVRDEPCAGCGSVPVPTRLRPAECPRCGSAGRVTIEWKRDMFRDEVVFVARCHGGGARAVMREARLLDVGHAGAVAETVAKAIAGLGP